MMRALVLTTALLFVGQAEAKCSLKALFYGDIVLKIETHDIAGSPGMRYETGVLVAKSNPGKTLGRLDEPVRDDVRPIANARGESCGELTSNMKIMHGDLPLRLKRNGPESFRVLQGNQVVGTLTGRLNRDTEAVSEDVELKSH